MTTESQPQDQERPKPDPERTDEEKLIGLSERFIGRLSDYTITESKPKPKSKPKAK